MKIPALSFVMLLLASATTAAQPPLHYWGTLQNDEATGVIELDGQLYAVKAGDVIPGRGTVQAVTNDEAVVLYELNDAEKQELADHGRLVIGARQMHLRNVLRLVPMPERTR